MIDTSAFETSVVITELSEKNEIHVVDFKDKQGQTVANYKYRIRKSKNSGEIQQ